MGNLQKLTLLTLGLGAALSMAGCEAKPPLDLEPGCNPILHGVECGLPYPSDFFLTDDETMPSKKRVFIDAPAKLISNTGYSADVNDFIAQDGFSRQPSIVWTFGVRTDPASVPGYFADPADTLTSHPIALLDDDGNRVPFFIDVDPHAEEDSREALVMRPLVRLKEKARYVVAVSGVVGVAGAIPVPEAFARLRDDDVGDDTVLGPLLRHYNDKIFPLVQKAGIARSSLQLAWDFTTGSDEHITRDLFRARELVLNELVAHPATVEIDSFFDGPAMGVVFNSRPELTWRVVKLRVTGPRVVDTDDPGAMPFRDAAGEVALNGTNTFSATVIVPASVRDKFNAAPVLLYGHGFFGDQEEVEDGSQRKIGDVSGRVMFAIDWLGMSSEDIGTVTVSAGDNVAETLRFGERLPQAMMNWLSLTDAIRSGALDDLEFTSGATVIKPFRRPDSGDGFSQQGRRSNAGDLIFEKEGIGFLGISQGHILGAIASAINPHVGPVVLEVGGAGFTHMMFRANPFSRFLFLLELSVPEPLDQQKLAAQFQRGFDRFDPATWAPWLLDEDIPSGPLRHAEGRRVLMQMGLGDASVPNLGTMLHARYLNLPYIQASTVPAPFGLEVEQAPHDGSGFVIFDFGVDPAIAGVASFPPDNDVHDGLRSTPESLTQVGAFLQEGVIAPACALPCEQLAP